MIKKAFISGASHGIGKAIAYQLASHGCHLALNCKNSGETLTQLCIELENQYGIRAIPLIGDIGDYPTVCDLFTQIKQQMGDLHLLINNAGISQIGLLSELEVRDWQQMIDTNLSSVFYCCKMAIPGMVRRQAGKILNISSVWGEAGASCEAAYSAAKGGVNALTKALAKELAPSGIQVNAIACGLIHTEMNLCFTEEERRSLIEEIPADRMGNTAEVAQMVCSVLSMPSYATGQIFTIDGGWR